VSAFGLAALLADFYFFLDCVAVGRGELVEQAAVHVATWMSMGFFLLVAWTWSFFFSNKRFLGCICYLGGVGSGRVHFM